MTGAVVLRATVGTALTTLVGGGLAFAMAVIAARAMGPSAKGAYDLLIATGALGALVLGYALPTGVTYVIAQDPRSANRAPLTGLAVAGLVGLVLAALLSLLFEPIVAIGILPPGSRLDVIVPVALLAAVTLYLGLTRAALVGVLRINTANLAETIGRAIAFCAALAIAAANIASPSALAFALVGGLGLGALLQTIALRPSGVLDRGTARAIARYATPSYLSSVMQFLNYRLDLFLVAALVGLADVGLYAAAVLVGQLVWLLARGAALALFPVVAGDRLDPRVLPRVAQASRLATLSGVAGAALLGAGGAFVLPAVFGADFGRAVPALWLLLPGIAAFCPVTIAGAYFLGAGKPRYNVIVSGSSLMVTVAADLLLIPTFGIAGAAAASSLSYSTALLVAVYYMRRSTGLSPSELLLPRADEVSLLLARLRGVLNNRAASTGA